jgi:hypothetical protein
VATLCDDYALSSRRGEHAVIGSRSALSGLVLAVAIIPVLAGCAASNDAATLQFHPPTDTAMATVGNLAIQNVFVLGAPLGRDLAKGQSASVFLAMINSGGTDTLLSITAPGTAASVTLPGPVRVVFNHPVFFSGPRPRVVLTDLTRTVTNGGTIKLVLMFQKAGPVTMLVPVMARATHWATFAPPQPIVSPAPLVTPPLATTPARHRRPHASATPSPSPA